MLKNNKLGSERYHETRKPLSYRSFNKEEIISVLWSRGVGMKVEFPKSLGT